MSKKVMKLASRGKRLGAYAIDKAIPFFLWIIIIAAVGDMYVYKSYNSYGYSYGYNSMSGGVGSKIAAVVICMMLLTAYTIVQIVFYAKSQTIGKAILGLQVVDSSKGEPIGIWKMLLREWFAKKASEVIFCIGYIWILIDDKNRGWHDKIMDTFVIDLRESEKLSVVREPAASKTETVATEPVVEAEPVTETEVEAVVETEPVVEVESVTEVDTAVEEEAVVEIEE